VKHDRGHQNDGGPCYGPPPMADAAKRREMDAAPVADDVRFDLALRPRTFLEVVGQTALVDNLRVFVQAAKARKEPLDHLLFCGPPGLGKTSLAHVIANEMASQIHVTSGPALERKGDLAGILTNLAEGDVLFIDEIHRLNPAIEENLYPAMETYTFDIVIGDGAGARAIKLPLKRFTLIGATTRTGLLTGPLRDRFGIVSRLDYYPASDLQEIVRRSAGKLGVRIDEGGAKEIARRARGTPRIANRLLRRVRDFAEVEGDGSVSRQGADRALLRLEVDGAGLDPMDRKILVTLIDKFGGGPVGLDTLATAVGEQSDTLEDVYEPYLMTEGYLVRTPRGRAATPRAFEHLGRKMPATVQGSFL
jgi:holliday junction DNA helicase RuvB